MQYVTTEHPQGICPSGWHIPTITEMITLQTNVNYEAAKLLDESQSAFDYTYTATNETGFQIIRTDDLGAKIIYTTTSINMSSKRS